VREVFWTASVILALDATPQGDWGYLFTRVMGLYRILMEMESVSALR
jgi:hypothetical protein